MEISERKAANLEEERSEVCILMVDDSDDDVFLFHEAFEMIDSSFERLVARNGLEAIELLARLHDANRLPHLVLMDLNMPIMDGCLALRKIRTEMGMSELNVVIFTSSELVEDSQTAYDSGANACVRKPDSYLDWVEVLRSLTTFFGPPEGTRG